MNVLLNRTFRFLGAFLIAGIVIVALCAAANWWVVRIGGRCVEADLARLPQVDAAIVLGTSPTVGGGRWSNPFFVGRMDAAARLYREGKVRHLLVSGDNHHRDYDEPSAMKAALLARGIPVGAITLDYAGFRTLDTMARARAVFGLERAIVVTDDFHIARSLFLAQSVGLDATGYPSARVPFRWSKKTRGRELFSRVKAWLDVYVMHTQPKFFGPKVELGSQA